MSITLIACTDQNLGIGDADGNLLFKFPKDLAMFKAVTSGKHVVMGRKTWDSLPVKPLPKRKNYVLTNNESFEVKGRTKILSSVEDVLELAKTRDVFVIGGGEIYSQLIEHADKLILTHVHTVSANAVTFFPEYSPEDWKLMNVNKNEADTKHPHGFTIATYMKRAKYLALEQLMKVNLEEVATKENTTQE